MTLKWATAAAVFLMVAAGSVFGQVGSPDPQSVPQSVPQSMSKSISPPQATTAPGEFSPFEVDGNATWSPRATLEGGGGFSRDSWSAGFGGRFPVADHLFGIVGFSYTGVVYDFSGDPDIGGSRKPWSQVDVFSISAGAFDKIDDRWVVFGGVRITSAGQPGADLGDTLTYGGLLGADYRFSDTLSVGFAIAGQSRIEGGPVIVPLPTISWVLPTGDDKWRLFSGGAGGLDTGGPASSGVGVGLSYKPDDRLTLAVGLSGLGLANDFRLNNHSPIPGGVVQDRYTQLVLSANFHPA